MSEAQLQAARPTPLHEVHAARGAIFAERAGFLLPQHFGDPAAEALRARRAAAVFDLSHRGKVEARGQDRVKYLQSMLSNDLKALAPGQGCHACALTAKSKIVADFRLHVLEDRFLLDATRLAAGPLREHLTRFKVMAKVELVDVSDAQAEIGVEGPRAAQVVAAVLAGPPPDLAPYGIARVALAADIAGGGGAEVLLARHSFSGETGFRFYIEAARGASLLTALLERGAPLDAGPIGLDAIEMLRVENGYPLFGRDFDESAFPQEANLDHAISFTKGCFLGYEPIARIHFRGHVNKKLTGLFLNLSATAEGAPLPAAGTRLLDDAGKEVGHVTSPARSPSLEGRAIALAMLRREKLAAGTRLTLANDLGTAVVADLPFHRRPEG